MSITTRWFLQLAKAINLALNPHMCYSKYSVTNSTETLNLMFENFENQKLKITLISYELNTTPQLQL